MLERFGACFFSSQIRTNGARGGGRQACWPCGTGVSKPEGRSGVAEIRVAVAGLGAIGRVVARRISKGIPGLTLTAVAARDQAKARAWLEHEKIAAPVVELDALPGHCDLAVECAPAAAFEAICRPMLAAGKRVMVLSAGALLARP